MSIVSSIRDYVELLNTLSYSLESQVTSTKFITATFFYFLETLKYSFYYIFSLQWLRDFTLLPITIPQISQTIFSENLFLETPGKVFFEFLEIPSLYQNKFILGFFNSFFLTLPITVTHIIAFRRLIIQGIPAALFSFFGFIIGQTLFILCVTFGIRSILIPWLTLEPLNYIIGLVLIFQIVYSMVSESLTVLKWDNNLHKTSLDNNPHKTFFKFFFSNLILSWCEQSCIFQYFSNITLTGHPSILEGFSTKTTLASFFSHSNYILGIFLGSILFSLLWIFLIWQIKNFIVNFTKISATTFIQTLNRATIIIVLGFTLSSIPFYGLDYLVTAPLGFVSQDNVFKNTILDQNKLKDPLDSISNKKDIPLNVDVSIFDRGRYLVFPEDDFYSFEDLNYRGEMDWIRRIEKKSNIPDSKGNFLANFFSVGKVLKKQKDQSVGNGDFKPTELNIYAESNSLLPEGEILNYQFDDSVIPEVRFDNWYDLIDYDLPEFSLFYPDKEIKENYKNFNLYSFSHNFFHDTSTKQVNIEKSIKQKYYSNPIYKNLLALDIDLFLNRQPDSLFLGGEQELDLYEKRQIINSYYDSLRLYTNLPYSENFENFFNGTKSFTNKIYNQQFKGTLRAVRRLFSLSPTSTELISVATKPVHFDSILKYDQPLYEGNVKFSPYHEEIPEIELLNKNKSSRETDENISSSFLKEFISKPLYAGWDEKLRKFIITNKLLPRSSAGYEIIRSKEWNKKFTILDNNPHKTFKKSKFSRVNKSNLEKINFSVWPKTKKIFKKDQSEVPFVVLFTKNKNTDAKFYKTLPSNFKNVEKFAEIQTVESEKQSHQKITPIFDDVAPKRGGFVWPGNFSFDFKSIFK